MKKIKNLINRSESSTIVEIDHHTVQTMFGAVNGCHFGGRKIILKNKSSVRASVKWFPEALVAVVAPLP